MSDDDVIVAPLSSVRSPARTILRLSGRDLPDLARRWLGVAPALDYAPHRVEIPCATEVGDLRVPVLLLAFPAGRSYTREPVLEAHVPAGELLASLLLARLYELGARPAGPGEFTRRAFRNGRLGLSDACAVAGLIRAADDAERAAALRQAAGGEDAGIRALRERLLDLRRHLEAAVDFPDEEDVQAGLAPRGGLLDRAEEAAAALGALARARVPRRAAPRLLLLGPVNAGKSSLVRALVRGARAVVSPVAGTTLDLVPYQAELAGGPAVLYDSPGFPAGAYAAPAGAESFDAWLCLVPPGDDGAWTAGEGPPRLVVRSKADLPGAGGQEGAFAVSALSGRGLAELRERLDRLAGAVPPPPAPLDALRDRLAVLVRDRLPEVRRLLAAGAGEELAAYELDELLEEFALLLRGDREDLLDAVFRDFCIGK